MNLRVNKTTNLQGKATLPSSKSQTIRALILATLANGESVIKNVLDCEDVRSAISVCGGLGVEIERDGEDMLVRSNGLPLPPPLTPSPRRTGGENNLNSGDSGITTRFIMPVLGLRQNSNEEIILDCGEQMKKRPVTPLINALNDLGLKIKSLNNNGACPILAQGELQGGQTEIDGITSQYLSALLLSLPCAREDSEIKVSNLNERPYVDMTLQWLKEQDIIYDYRCENNLDIYNIKGGQNYHSFNKTISADFSSASYLIAAAVLLPSEVELIGLDINDKQGDKRLVEILQDMGADIKINGLKMVIKGGKKLNGQIIDCNDIPDMVPTLAIIGTQAQGKTELTNVSQARIKETDRLHSMSEGLKRMGAKIEEKDDGLVIYQSDLKGAQVRGYGDHRTVMALSVAGLLSEGQTIIDTAESINKTFPNYIELMRSIGSNMEAVT